jgi:hypothetical protein
MNSKYFSYAYTTKVYNLLKNNNNLWNINSIQKPVNNELLDAGDFPNNITEYLWISNDKIRWDKEINLFMKLNNGNYAYFYSGETLGGFYQAIIENKYCSSLDLKDTDNFFATTMELYICKDFEGLIELIRNNENPLIYKYYLLDIKKN